MSEKVVRQAGIGVELLVAKEPEQHVAACLGEIGKSMFLLNLTL